MYKPIENYGLIGDMRTAALVSTDGSIDWMCYPHFDSPSIFAALLDDRHGGRFAIRPLAAGAAAKQFYWPETNVLVTRFLSSEGAAEITDFMPVGLSGPGQTGQLVRIVHVTSGRMRFDVQCCPAFDYARQAARASAAPWGARFAGPGLDLALLASVPLQVDAHAARAHFELGEQDEAIFVLRRFSGDDAPSHAGQVERLQQTAELLLRQTIDYWRGWLKHCTYTGRWREMVHRSALALKLMTFEPTGAIIAAPTCSLPETVGGERNWDYRYAWVRDAAFTVYALLRLGFSREAERFVEWIQSLCHRGGATGPVQVMYGIDGRRQLEEFELDHLEGYRGSRPVRVGNAAYSQLQMDIYGELLDAVYLYNKHGAWISYDTWVRLLDLLDWVCENWQRPDSGIWEVRGENRHYVCSKMMCWVALDRGLRIATKRALPAAYDRYQRCRDEIYKDVMTQGYNAQRQTFVQSYGCEDLDASALIMPLVFFASPNDPRMSSTLEAILRHPSRGGLTSNSQVYRYLNEDNLPGREGTFNVCSFWLVEALTRAARGDPCRLEQARLIFERMLALANPLGLYAEQIGPCGEALGNFPQALTHISLISAACNLDRALGQRG